MILNLKYIIKNMHHQRYASYTAGGGEGSGSQKELATYVVGPLMNNQGSGGMQYYQAQMQNYLQHQAKSADFDEQALIQDYLMSQGLLSPQSVNGMPLVYQPTSGHLGQQQQHRSQSQIQIAMQQQQNAADMMMRKKQLSIDVTRQQQAQMMMVRAPQNMSRGPVNQGIVRQQQPAHVPKKKSIVVSQVSGSSYKPSNIPSQYSMKESNRKSLGGAPGDLRLADSSQSMTSSLGLRSKSISSQNEAVAFERQDVQVSQFNLKNAPLLMGTTNSGQIGSLPFGEPQYQNNYMPLDQRLQEVQMQKNYPYENEKEPSLYYHQNDFAQHSMLRVQRYEQMLQKQKNIPKPQQAIGVSKGPQVQAPTIPLNMQNLMNLNSMSDVIEQKNFNFMPQIGVKDLKIDYDFTQGLPQSQQQQLSYDKNELQYLQPTMFSQIQGNPVQAQFQTQSSNSSSSGNISSSWLSQSQQSSQQQTKIFPQGMVTMCQSQDQNCQCTRCLKIQMARLQEMLFQQEQLINQQTSQAVQYQGQEIPKISQGSIHLTQAIQPSLSSNNNNGLVNISNYHNQSSSVWASSTSQLSPQSQTVTSVHSSIQSVDVAVVGDPTITQNDYSSDGGGLVRMMTQTADSVQSMQTFQDPRQLESYSDDMTMVPAAATTGQSERRGISRVTRGNEDETIVEERKSDENTEEEESESIPDEIEQQQQRNEMYQEEIARMYGDPNAMRVLYQGSEVVGEGKQGRAQVQLYYSAHNDIDGSGGGTDSQPYWIQIQTQNIQMNQAPTANKKNYIELPLGEIPEMKESFYDEVSRWSQVFGNTSQSQSRTKTPNGTNRSQLNLQADQSHNTHSSNNISNKDWQGNAKNQTTEEDKEDLFLYSQGESGATFNRTENESSFLTSEKNKFNACLGGGQYETQVIKPEQQSPSFEALKEMNISKTSKTVDKWSNSISNNLLSQQNQQMFSELKRVVSEVNDEVHVANDQNQPYPNSIEKKRPLPDYSASSAKYFNQSLTFTPSQQQTPEGNIKNQSMDLGLQKDFPHVVLNYDQMTPVQNRKTFQTQDDIDKAYECLNNQEFLGIIEQSLHNHKLSVATQNCKILDEGLDFNKDRLSSQNSGYNSRPNKGSQIKSEGVQQQCEIILSPLPPIPFSADDTPEEQNRKVTHQNLEHLVSVRTISQMSSHIQSSNQEIVYNQPKSRQNSLSYEKDRATKIINYILDSDQKKSGHHTMKSSIISRGTSGGYHRPNVLSQVNHIFPNLDEVFNTDQGLRTTKHVSQYSTGEKLQSIKLETLKPTHTEEVLIWSASISNTPDDRELDLSKLKPLPNQPYSSQKPQLDSNFKTASNDTSVPVANHLLTKNTLKQPESKTNNQWQSRNLKSQTQKIAGTKYLSTNFVFDFNQTTSIHHLASASTQRIRSLETGDSLERKRGGAITNRSDERKQQTIQQVVRGGPFMIGGIIKERRDSKSPIGVGEKQKHSRIVGMIQSKSKGRNEQQRSQKSHSPIRYEKQPTLFNKQLLNFNQTTQLTGMSQANLLGKQKKLIVKKQSQGQSNKNHSQNTTPQPFASRAVSNLQLSSSTSKQPQQISSNKYLPSMFDRLKKKQIFSMTQKVQQKDPQYINDNYYLLNALPGAPQTSRNESTKRISQERTGGAAGETRNSSCSSGANNSGSRKRKFSKIVFEISELPSVSAINRSLSIKRQRDHAMKPGGLGQSSSFRMIQLTQKDQQAIKNRIEKEQKSIAFKKLTASSISPKRLINSQVVQNQGIQLIPAQQQVSQLQSSNRSYNSSSEFIVTHENFQIRQMTSEEAGITQTSSSDFGVNGRTQQTLITQESQNDPHYNRTLTKNSSNHSGGPLQLQIQIQSRNQSNLQRSNQTDAPQRRVQNFIIETQNTPTQGESSKAFVQSLLTNNENVSTTLSRLFGQKHRSKNQSLINESDETSLLQQNRQVVQMDAQKSPIPGHQSKQKQLSPSQKFSDDRRQIFSMQVPPSISSNQAQAQKVCLPNSIFFNQSAKVPTTNVLNQVPSSKLIATNQIQLIKKPTHQRGSGGQYK